MRDAHCCVGGDATEEEEGKLLIDWNGIKIVETDCMLPTDRVKPYARNAKRHPQEQIDEIKASIKRFGMDDPIGIWGKENLIVEGHGRLEACKQLGIPTVPCIRLDHLTKEERKAYTLAHNKTNMDSGWDFTALDQELAEIVDIDMSEFGFGSLEEARDVEEIDNIKSEDKRIEHRMTIDKQTIALTEEEYDGITTKLEHYVNENGVSFGFVGSLLHDCNA